MLLLYPFRDRSFLFFLLLISLYIAITVTPAVAIDEYTLFKEGYDLYLSCEPARASEKFRTFLKEFPNSTAKDSVLFWLGKALMQLNRLTESEMVFNDLRREFQNSPFSLLAGRELERVRSLIMGSGLDSVSMGKKNIDEEIKESLLKDKQKEIEWLKGEVDSVTKRIAECEKREGELRREVEAGNRREEECKKMLAGLEKKEEDIKALIRDKEVIGKRLAELEKDVLVKAEEIKKLEDERNRLRAEIAGIHKELSTMSESNRDVKDKERLLAEREKEIKELKADISRKQEEQRRLKMEIDNLGKEKEKFITELGQLRDIYGKVLKERDLLQEYLKTAAEKVVELKEKVDVNRRLEKDLRETEKRAKALEIELRDAVERENKIRDEKERFRLSQEDLHREIESLKNKISEFNKREDGLVKAKELAEKEVLELKKRMREIEEKHALGLGKLAEERDRLRSLLSEEKKKCEGLSNQILALREKEKELLNLNNSLKGVMENRLSDMGLRLQACDRDLSGLKKERIEKEAELRRTVESLKADVSRIQELEAEKKGLESKVIELKERLKTVSRFIVIGNERYSPDHVSSYMFKSQLFLGKIGVRYLPWRNGVLNEDFIGEQILYNEAKRLDLKQEGNRDDLNKISNLTGEEADYLNRFMTISNLIDHEIKKLPPEISGEAVALRYSDNDRYEKASMVAEIQDKIRMGLSVKDIVKLFPGAEYRVLSGRDINELFGELSGHFSDNEVVSTFNKERFMVVSIRKRPIKYRPFEVTEEGVNRMIREFVKELILTLRTKWKVDFSD